jgi:hypothetical protein
VAMIQDAGLVPVEVEDDEKNGECEEQCDAQPKNEAACAFGCSFRTNPHEMSLLQKSDTAPAAEGWLKSNFA